MAGKGLFCNYYFINPIFKIRGGQMNTITFSDRKDDCKVIIIVN